MFLMSFMPDSVSPFPYFSYASADIVPRTSLLNALSVSGEMELEIILPKSSASNVPSYYFIIFSMHFSTPSPMRRCFFSCNRAHFSVSFIIGFLPSTSSLASAMAAIAAAAWELVRTVLKLPRSLDRGYCNVVMACPALPIEVLAKMGPLLSIEALLR